jgi:hypothetical protein
MLHWIFFCCISSCRGYSSSDYIDVSPIIPSFCRDPLDILVFLFPFFLNIPQECWVVFYSMVCCATVHTCRWWKWKIPFLMFWLLEIVAQYWSFASSKSSSTSSSTSVFTSISLRCIVLGYLVTLCGFILWLCIIILWLCIVVFLLHIVVWWWYLVELRRNLSCHHFFLKPISI